MVADAHTRIVNLEQEVAILQAIAEARAQAAGPEPEPAVVSATQPLRSADRQPFHEQIQVRVDGAAALLVDLSLKGAQVVSDTALKPSHPVRIVLPVAEPAIACRGQVVWARLEPTEVRGSLRYRAGMLFTSADEAAIASFMAHHSALPPLRSGPPQAAAS